MEIRIMKIIKKEVDFKVYEKLSNNNYVDIWLDSSCLTVPEIKEVLDAEEINLLETKQIDCIVICL